VGAHGGRSRLCGGGPDLTLQVLVVAAVLAGVAIPAFHRTRCRPLAARCRSIRAGLCVPAIPLSVLVLVDSL
jgi:hypothetical protein